MRPIDLRSDTVTQPSEGMRKAMASAKVGDDQYGEDPSVNLLEKTLARLLGKEAAVFLASGTMANQVALRTLCRPGDEVLVGGEAHVLWHESGAAAISGVQLTSLGSSGIFDAEDVHAGFKPPGHVVFPPTTLVTVENTHNRGGGVVFPYDTMVAVCDAAAELGMNSYLDGARLFNASLYTKRTLRDLAAPFRMASISLSKGLGCPVGSVLAGSAEDIVSARRVRRTLGGAMRQAGVLAAAGLYAIERNVERLEQDHSNARLIAQVLAGNPLVQLDLATVQTNIVIFRTSGDGPDAATVVERAKRQNILVSAFGPRTVRVTTHLDVATYDCERAADILNKCVSEQ